MKAEEEEFFMRKLNSKDALRLLKKMPARTTNQTQILVSKLNKEDKIKYRDMVRGHPLKPRVKKPKQLSMKFESVNEKFIEKSDPIRDMGIGSPDYKEYQKTWELINKDQYFKPPEVQAKFVEQWEKYKDIDTEYLEEAQQYVVSDKELNNYWKQEEKLAKISYEKYLAFTQVPKPDSTSTLTEINNYLKHEKINLTESLNGVNDYTKIYYDYKDNTSLGVYANIKAIQVVEGYKNRVKENLQNIKDVEALKTKLGY
jgi:hypothetical protein